MGLGVKRKISSWMRSVRERKRRLVKWLNPHLEFIFKGKKVTDFKAVPIVINNFNRLAMMRRLIDSLTSRGYNNIYIIDNGSDYPPLLEWYKSCGYPVFFLNRNVGHLAVWETGIYKQFTDSFFVYTDSDVEICEDCPDDFMEKFINLLQKHPSALKAGFSLRIDDLPACFDKREEVVSWEGQFWKKKIEDDAYDALIDTTFAVYKPFFKGEYIDPTCLCIRTAPPYSSRHLPWYVDSACKSEEEKYYLSKIKTDTHWSQQAK